MVVNRLAGLVLPTSSKYLMDDVVGRQNWDLLPKLALAVGLATLVESITSFSLSQVLGVAAQAGDYRDAERRRSACHAAAGQLLRLDQDWCTDLTHHEPTPKGFETWSGRALSS